MDFDMKSRKQVIHIADFPGVEAEIKSELDSGIINGAVISAGTADETRFEKAWGFADTGTRMRTDTVIDMASVTKALATSSALAICRDDGLIDFDRPFTDYLPAYRAPLAKSITVRDLAMHVSGFGAQKYYTAATGREIRRNLLLAPPPGRHGDFEYSCWNFQLLGMLVEEVSGCSLPDFCHNRIFAQLGMHDTSLGKPLTEDPARLARTCAAAGPGRISDEMAFRLYRDGFSAGNAGAFSCAADLAAFCKCMLKGGEYAPGKRLFSAYSFDALTAPRIHAGAVQRSFGWIVADEFKPSGFSAHTVYHSGWSGQTLFMDLNKRFYAVILTTRTLNEYERARQGRFKLISELGNNIMIY
ncbi:MAG: serine hydrolase domain-containing protein [Victivallaceae bacterium]|jgi:CubicO group peptidase (beta-lactamase class C family)